MGFCARGFCCNSWSLVRDVEYQDFIGSLLCWREEITEGRDVFSNQSTSNCEEKGKKNPPISELPTTGKFRLSEWFLTTKTFFHSSAKKHGQDNKLQARNTMKWIMAHYWHRKWDGFDKISPHRWFSGHTISKKTLWGVFWRNVVIVFPCLLFACSIIEQKGSPLQEEIQHPFCSGRLSLPAPHEFCPKNHLVGAWVGWK